MTQLVLVLEENPEIQFVIASSLKTSEISVVQESNPDLFVEQAKYLKPDLIFLSNTDCDRDYKICREIRKEQEFSTTPIILLANAKDEIDEVLLSKLGINGLLRKPFEGSMLQEQLDPFITLNDNYGNDPDKNNEEFLVDMSSIDNQLKEIEKGILPSNTTTIDDAQAVDSLEQSDFAPSLSSKPGSEMDSVILGNILLDRNQQETPLRAQETKLEEIEIGDIGQEKITEEEIIVEVLEENSEDEMGMDDGFEFDLKLDEDEVENISTSVEKEIITEAPESVTDGLEQLKNSGLEDKFAENRLAETLMKDHVEETEQKLRGGLTDIDLEFNDFEAPDEILTRSPDLNQTLREGLTDISLVESDFQPDYPDNLSSFEVEDDPPLETDETVGDSVDNAEDMDNVELKVDSAEEFLEDESSFDNLLLTDSIEQIIGEELTAVEDEEDDEKIEKIEDVEQFVLETSEDELEEMLDVDSEDAEISTMVRDSFIEQADSAESALGELEDLSEQMAVLDSEETEFEDELENEELPMEEMSPNDTTESEADLEEDNAVYMEENLGDLLEADEVDETDEFPEITIVEELEEIVIDGLGEMVDDLEEIETEILSETSIHLNEEVFDSWSDAEDAFMGFDRDTVFADSPDEQRFEKSMSYNFTEEELKEIVSSSVQKALEKSIATSLVELAVSELKNQVAQMDQSRV